MFNNDKVRQRLAEGAEILNVPLTAQMANKLCSYLELLGRWSDLFNLTAIPRYQWVEKHILDSFSAFPFLPTDAEPASSAHGENILIADIGSGAGLPGIPLAIVAPNTHWLLLEKTGKKAGFLMRVALELDLQNVDVVNLSAEQYIKSSQSRQDSQVGLNSQSGHKNQTGHNSHPGLNSQAGQNSPDKQQPPLMNAVIARALGDDIKLCALAYPLLQKGGIVIAMRGRHKQEEAHTLTSDSNLPHNKLWDLITVQKTRIPFMPDNRNIIVWKKK